MVGGLTRVKDPVKYTSICYTVRHGSQLLERGNAEGQKYTVAPGGRRVEQMW
jgi:hypothetical protein